MTTRYTTNRRTQTVAGFGAFCALAAMSFVTGSAGQETAGNRIGAVLPLQGEITDITTASLKRRIDAARQRGASVIILNLDTPGGLVSSSIAIADLLRNLSDVKTVAWVNPDALSGGSLVAVACDEIVMAKSSRMGDSQVIMGDLTGVKAVPEELQPKAYSPVLHDFKTSARRNGYSEVLAEAFVIPEREVWWVENIRTGEREFVLTEEKEKRTKAEAPPSGEAPGEKPTAEWRLVENYHDVLSNANVPVRQPIDGKDQLLVLSPGEAMAYGFCKGIVADEGDLRTRYGLSDVIHLQPVWSESLAGWLTSVYVRGFLLVVIFLSGYVEFHSPGVGLPGLVALIALAVFVGAPYVSGLANVWEIVLIVVGLVLIALELFVIPGFGIAGVSGVMLVLAGLVATFVPDEPGRTFPSLFPALPTTLNGLRIAVITLVSSMLVSLAGMVMLSRILPRVPVFNRLIPANPTPSEVAIDDPYWGVARVGDVGLAEGTLRPAGKARFGALLVDVVSEGEFIPADARVEVIERRGNRVVVRQARA